MSESPLLHILSSKGKINIDQFNKFHSMTGSASENETEETSGNSYDKNLTIRNLDALGFCEFDFDKRTVSVCPPFLIQLPTYGLPTAILVGARTASLIRQLRDSVKKRKEQSSITIFQQSDRNCNYPDLVRIEALNTHILAEIADECDIGKKVDNPAAWNLVKFSKGLAEFEQSLKFSQRQEPNWPCRVFSLAHLMFLPDLKGSKRGNLELKKYTNPVDRQQQHWIWNENLAAEADLDWARYFILTKSGQNVLLYDEKLKKVAIPARVPLPRILARAATACSGLVPAQGRVGSGQVAGIPPGHDIQIYSNVLEPIIHEIANKLCQQIVTCSLDNGVARCKS